MPGPFPGMDPYLEDPFIWQGVHNTLITYIAAALNAVLPPDYVADTGVRCLIERQMSAIIPDVIVQEERALVLLERSGSVAVLETPRKIDTTLRLRSVAVLENREK